MTQFKQIFGLDLEWTKNGLKKLFMKNQIEKKRKNS